MVVWGLKDLLDGDEGLLKLKVQAVILLPYKSIFFINIAIVIKARDVVWGNGPQYIHNLISIQDCCSERIVMKNIIF